MRHGVKLNPLGRKKAHRKALMRNLTRQLVKHKRIVTTLAKAKALRKHVEPILTKTKNDTTHNRRVVFSYIQDKETIKELFGPVSQKIANRPGGYCRIIKLDQRRGDNADMAMIELVDFNETYDTSTEVGTKKKRTRRTRKKKVATSTPTPEASAEEEAREAVVEESVANETTVTENTDTTEGVTESTEEVVEEALQEETPIENDEASEANADEEISNDETGSEEEKEV